MKKLLSLIGFFGFILISSQAQEVSTIKTDTVKIAKSTYIKIKEGASPDVYINGKKVDPEIIELIDPSKIERVEVIKGEAARQKYNADNVINITTKKGIDESQINIKVIEKIPPDDTEEMPVIIINGKVSDRKTFEKISPDDVESISVLKDKDALEKYKTNVGVIVITLKKKE